MANQSRRTLVAAARRAAEARGYYVREGSYRSEDNRIGRWYVGQESEEFYRPHGAGYCTPGAAWIAAAEHLAQAEA